LADKIIKLVEVSKPVSPHEVTECMKTFQEEVESGTIAGFVVGYMRTTGDFGSIITASSDACRLLGAVEYAKHRLCGVIDNGD
jgi:ABC-type sulfate transport system permease component